MLGNKVGILDADIYGPSMPIMFDLEGYTPQAVNVNGKNKMEPPSNYDIKIASIGFFAKPNQALVWRGPMASKALNQLLKDTHWGELDYLIVDLPLGPRYTSIIAASYTISSELLLLVHLSMLL